MDMQHLTLFKIIILAVIQGLAELLPVSSSAHVIVAEKFMGFRATTPEMVYLLVMLHTGTMFAVITYFWRDWKALLLDRQRRKSLFWMCFWGTGATGVVGLTLMEVIEKGFLHGRAVENIFGNVTLISVALACSGILILFSTGKRWKKNESEAKNQSVKLGVWVGAVQGLCLPFRGFSRSGATISVGMIAGMTKRFSEQFSFLLAVILTPPVIVREILRMEHSGVKPHFVPGLIGLFFSFLAGLVAIAWLSRWLEKGKWGYFGIYCLIFSAVLFFHIL